MDISITGLTADQVEMLDFMWQLDSEQDFDNWFDCLDHADQQQAMVLRELILMENMESRVGYFKPAVIDYLAKFRI